MIVRAPWSHGTTYIDGREVEFINYETEVPVKTAFKLIIGGQYSLSPHNFKPIAECKKFLLIRGSGLGDVMFCNPIRRAIKKINPKVHITFMTSGEFAGLVWRDKTIDRFVRIHQFEKIAQTWFDHVSNLNETEHSHMGEFRNKHKIDLFANRLGLPPVKNKQLEYHVKEGEVEWATKEMRSEKRVISIVLRSTCDSKNISIPVIMEVCAILLSEGFVPLIFDKDKKQFGRFKKFIPQGIRNACGKYNLRQCGALLNYCDAVLTPDTGFLHLATALGKKIVAYFGSIGPELSLTPGRIKVLERKHVECYPCNSFECHNNTKKCLRFSAKELAIAVMGAAAMMQLPLGVPKSAGFADRFRETLF